MRNIFGLFLILTLTISCDDKTNVGHTQREFESDKGLNLRPEMPETPFIITNGDDLVFRYTLNHPDEEMIADDELSELFVFSVPSGQDSFKITLSEVTGAASSPMAYHRLCFCYFPLGFTIQNATVSGTKIDENKWNISFNLKASDGDHEYELSDEGVYKAGTL